MKRGASRLAFLGRIEGLPVAAVLLILYAAFFVTAPRVFSGYLIYMSFLQTVPPVLVCALGLTLVITAGEIDLSFPAVVAFSGFVFVWVFRNTESAWIGMFAALVAGGVVGYVNGLLVARIGVPSIMATLATQFFWYGVTVLLAGGLSWNIREIRGTAVHDIFTGRLFGVVPTQAIWALLLAIFLWFLLNRHRFGEAILFIGDNADVARVMGVNVEATRVRLFTLMGIIGGFAGVILTSEINVFFPTQGGGFLLPVMAAVFIGGTSIAGGSGSVIGTLFGAYIIGSLEAGVVATGISGYWVQLVEGVVMGASVVLNIVIEQGRFAKLQQRFGQWNKFVRPNSGQALTSQEDSARR